METPTISEIVGRWLGFCGYIRDSGTTQWYYRKTVIHNNDVTERQWWASEKAQPLKLT